jgi:hypothetical protein
MVVLHSEQLEDQFDNCLDEIFKQEQSQDLDFVITEAISYFNNIVENAFKSNIYLTYSCIVQDTTSEEYAGPVFQMHVYHTDEIIEDDDFYIQLSGEVSWKLYLLFCYINDLEGTYRIASVND